MDTQQNGINQRICRNVKLLARVTKRRIKDIETAAGVSEGYFSRCRKSNSVPGIDTVSKVAQYFSISIDELISGTYDKTLLIPEIRRKLSDIMKLYGDQFSKEEMIRIWQEDKP